MSETIPLLPEKVYHIYNHANGNENLFRNAENYSYFLKKYNEYMYPIVDTFAYCLMPNHFHLMIKVRSEDEIISYLNEKRISQGLKKLSDYTIAHEISKQFSHLFNGYTKAFNIMFDRKGSLFMPRFKRKLVHDDIYFTQLIAYIHLNPVKHGFCKQILDWEHSSIHAYYLNRPTKLNCQYLNQWFGDKEALIKFHEGLNIDDSFFDL